MLRTFLDAGVLIAATRLAGPDSRRALQFLEDPNRVFLTSPFIHLEVVPKAIYNRMHLEQSFYDRFFRAAVWYRDVERIVAVAQAEASKSGLAALDALHLAAAQLSHADEFVTTEKPSKPLYRTSLVKVVYLFL